MLRLKFSGPIYDTYHTYDRKIEEAAALFGKGNGSVVSTRIDAVLHTPEAPYATRTQRQCLTIFAIFSSKQRVLRVSSNPTNFSSNLHTRTVHSAFQAIFATWASVPTTHTRRSRTPPIRRTRRQPRPPPAVRPTRRDTLAATHPPPAAMLHAVKKTVAKASAPSRGVNPPAEFLDLKTQLAAVKRNITLVDKKMTDANKAWAQQMMEQRRFSERFAEGYPSTSDDTAVIASEFAESSQSLYDHFVRETDPAAQNYMKMQEQVQVYLKEIAEVEAMYPKLTEAKSETARYQGKIDTIERSKKNDEAKKNRNLQKMDSEKEKYDELAKTVVIAQKKTLAKSATVHKLALCAYWSSNAAHIQIQQESMQRTSDFARSHEDELAALDITSLDLSESAVLAASPQVPTDAPMSPQGTVASSGKLPA